MPIFFDKKKELHFCSYNANAAEKIGWKEKALFPIAVGVGDDDFIEAKAQLTQVFVGNTPKVSNDWNKLKY